MDWNNIWNSIVNFFKTSGLQLLYAVLVLVLGIIIIKILLKILEKSFAKSKMEKITQSFVLSILKFIAYVLLWIIILSMLGIDITGLIALIAAAGVAVGLALQDSLSNLANGIIIITTKPFKEGDLINVSGVEGKVYSINMLTTKLLTVDNKMIVLPNSSIVTSAVTNYNEEQKRRIDFTFSVDYASDLNLVKKTILDVMKSDGRVYLTPAPFVSLKNFSESSLDFFANCWVDSADYWDVFYYIMDNVYNEFKRNNINIPYNQMEVRLRNDQVSAPFDETPLKKRTEIEREFNPNEEKPFSNLLFNIKKTRKTSKKNKISKLSKEKEKQQKKLEQLNKNLAELEKQIEQQKAPTLENSIPAQIQDDDD